MGISEYELKTAKEQKIYSKETIVLINSYIYTPLKNLVVIELISSLVNTLNNLLDEIKEITTLRYSIMTVM